MGPAFLQHSNTPTLQYSVFFSHFRSFLLNKITPIIATSSSTETTSNGSRYCVNNSLPSAAVSPSSLGADKFAPGFAARIDFTKIITMAPTDQSGDEAELF